MGTNQVDTTFTCRWNRSPKVMSYVHHPSRSNLWTTLSSNATSTSENGAHKQRLRGIYANVSFTNALRVPTEWSILTFSLISQITLPTLLLTFSNDHCMLCGHLLHSVFTIISHLWHSEGRAGQRTCQYLSGSVIWRSFAGISVSSFTYLTAGLLCVVAPCGGISFLKAQIKVLK